jgi:hypothetical protein
MFMVKEEYANIKNLCKVMLITDKHRFLWLFIPTAIFLALSIASTVSDIMFHHGDVRQINIADYSVMFISVIVIMYLTIMFMYRNTNAKLSVFPQTNNTRFIASLIDHYSFAFVLCLTVLGMYLIHLGIIKVMSLLREDIFFALTVDAGFIITGFFVYLLYIFIILSVIELAGTILRKWTYYAAGAFVAAITLIIVNLPHVIEYTPKVLAFLISEPSLPMFFLKGLGLWLVITALALLINCRTVYYKSQSKIKRKDIVTICAVFTAATVFILWAVIRFIATPDVFFPASETGGLQAEHLFANHQTIRIDVSHLPKGSNINIQGENIAVMAEDGSVSNYHYNSDAVVRGAELLHNLQGDTVVLFFRPVSFVANGIEIMQFSNPRITAHLDGETLFIFHIRDNANVVIMPIWMIARQFDRFTDRELFPAHSVGFSSGWFGSGWFGSTNIHIHVE